MDGLVQALNRSSLVLEISLDARIVRANDCFLDRTGFGSEELNGLALQSLLSPLYIQSTEYTDLWAALSAGGFFSGEFLIHSKDRHWGTSAGGAPQKKGCQSSPMHGKAGPVPAVDP